MAYLDTSVVAAYYCPEALSAKVQRVLSRTDVPAISHLVELELASALSQKVRMKEMDAASANQVVSLFQVHLSNSYYRMLPIHQREYALARDWLARFSTPLRALDALHLAVAFSHGLTVITADKGLSDSARMLGLKCQVIS